MMLWSRLMRSSPVTRSLPRCDRSAIPTAPHGGVFCCCIAIVSRHRPSGGFFERGAELLVVSLES